MLKCSLVNLGYELTKAVGPRAVLAVCGVLPPTWQNVMCQAPVGGQRVLQIPPCSSSSCTASSMVQQTQPCVIALLLLPRHALASR